MLVGKTEKTVPAYISQGVNNWLNHTVNLERIGGLLGGNIGLESLINGIEIILRRLNEVTSQQKSCVNIDWNYLGHGLYILGTR